MGLQSSEKDEARCTPRVRLRLLIGISENWLKTFEHTEGGSGQYPRPFSLLLRIDVLQRLYNALVASSASLLGAATENLDSPVAFQSTNSSPRFSEEYTIGTLPAIIS